MANVLSLDKQATIIGLLAEGSSIRSIERVTGVHRDTIMRLGYHYFGCAKTSLGLHFAYYNFVKRHITLRATPAMAAGVENTFWTVPELLEAAA